MAEGDWNNRAGPYQIVGIINPAIAVGRDPERKTDNSGMSGDTGKNILDSEGSILH